MEHIKEKVKKVISYSQETIPNPLVDPLIDQWYVAKSRFIRAWGGYAYEVGKMSFDLSEEAKSQNFNDFIYRINNRYFNCYDLIMFLREQGYEAFYKNLVLKSYTLKTGAIIPQGSKLIKAFKFFIENSTVLREIQDEASLEVQKNKLEGTLMLSVHPLDFLSSSENTYKWRSCHALDGEYRAGNLSYMVDSSTIICYIKGEDEMKLPNFPEDVLWNSKKWRMLLFTNAEDSLLFAGKQYPFEVEDILNKIKENYLKSMNKGWSIEDFSSWHNDFARPTITYANGEDCEDKQVADYTYYFINNGIYKRTNIIKDIKGSYHFNDLLRSSTYVPYYCWLKTHYNPIYKIKIGGTTSCLRCGEDIICSTDTMLCESCELRYGESEDERFVYCEMCGQRLLSDDAYWCDDVGYVCGDCYEDNCDTCHHCGEIIELNRAHYETDEDGVENCYCHLCYIHNGHTSNPIPHLIYSRDIGDLPF